MSNQTVTAILRPVSEAPKGGVESVCLCRSAFSVSWFVGRVTPDGYCVGERLPDGYMSGVTHFAPLHDA